MYVFEASFEVVTPTFIGGLQTYKNTDDLSFYHPAIKSFGNVLIAYQGQTD